MAGAGGIRAGAAYVELGAVDTGLQKTLDASAAKLRAWGQSLVDVGKQLAVIGGAATAAFGAATVAFASSGAELERMSQRLGVPVERLQEFGYAAKQVGGDLGLVESSIAGVNEKTIELMKGEAGMVALFGMVKRRAKDLEGIDPAARWAEMVKAVGEMKDPVLRTYAATKLLGDPRLGQLAAEGLAGFTEEAQRLGIVMSSETVKGAHDLERALTGLRLQGSAVSNAIGAALAPAMQSLAEAMGPLVKSAIDWLRENKDTVATVARVAVAVTGLGFALIGVGVALKTVGFTLGIVSTALKLLGVGKLIDIALWGAWVIAVGLAKGAMIAWSAVATAATLTMGVLSSVMTVATGVITGVATALTALNVVGLALSVAGLVIYVAALGVAFVVVAGAVWGVYRAFQAVISAVSGADFGRAFGGLTPILKEWGGIINDFAEALKVDMPLAWDFAVAAAELALAQLRAAWPPLWNYISTGFSDLWALIKAGFQAGFAEVVLFAKQAVVQILASMSGLALLPGGEGFAKGLAAGLGVFDEDKERKEVDRLKRKVENLQFFLKDALSTPVEFNFDTEAIDAARDKLKGLQDELAIAQAKKALKEHGLDAQGRPLGGAGKNVPGGLQQAFQASDVVVTSQRGIGGMLTGTTVDQYWKEQLDKLEAIRKNTEKPPAAIGAD